MTQPPIDRGKGILWMAQYTVKHGLSANAGLRIAQEYGLGVRRATWLQLVSQTRANYAIQLATIESLLVGLPQAGDIATIPTRQQGGYVQYVDLFVRDKTTGLIDIRPQAIRGSILLTRDAAIDFVMSRYATAVDRSKVSPAQWGTSPDEVVIGGYYTATHKLTPSDTY